ncbi:MAG: hypothetical protein ACK4YO_00720 [Candidatus Altarchaeaceae archaeon]
MKLTTLIGIILIILFFALPILTNFAFLPEDLKPHSIGEFLGGIFNYWIEVIKTIISVIKG